MERSVTWPKCAWRSSELSPHNLGYFTETGWWWWWRSVSSLPYTRDNTWGCRIWRRTTAMDLLPKCVMQMLVFMLVWQQQGHVHCSNYYIWCYICQITKQQKPCQFKNVKHLLSNLLSIFGIRVSKWCQTTLPTSVPLSFPPPDNITTSHFFFSKGRDVDSLDKPSKWKSSWPRASSQHLPLSRFAIEHGNSRPRNCLTAQVWEVALLRSGNCELEERTTLFLEGVRREGVETK